MKWTKPRIIEHTLDYEVRAKKYNIFARVIYSDVSNDYYFTLENLPSISGDKKFAFKSSWKYKPFRSEDSCKRACEKYIDDYMQRLKKDIKKERKLARKSAKKNI